MAADGYTVQLSGGLMDGEDIVRSLPEVIASKGGYDFEEYWHRLEIAAAVGALPATEVLDIDILDNARVIIVYGGEGVTVTYGGTGSDEVPCDPFAVACNETTGSGFDTITLTNSGSREQKVEVVVFSYKT